MFPEHPSVGAILFECGADNKKVAKVVTNAGLQLQTNVTYEVPVPKGNVPTSISQYTHAVVYKLHLLNVHCVSRSLI